MVGHFAWILYTLHIDSKFINAGCEFDGFRVKGWVLKQAGTNELVSEIIHFNNKTRIAKLIH